MSGRSGPWPIVEASPYPINNDGADHQMTMPLSGNTAGSPPANNYSSMPSEQAQELLTPGSSQISLRADSETRSNWLVRLLRHNRAD